MKTKLKTLLSLLIIMVVSINNLHADADADRRKRGKKKNPTYEYKYTLKFKGGKHNCGNNTWGSAWTPINLPGVNLTQRRDINDECLCSGETSWPIAVSGTAIANSTQLTAGTNIFAFSCKFPNKWKAGEFDLLNTYKTPLPMTIQKSATSVNYESSSSISVGSNNYNVVNSKVTLYDLKAKLKKFTPDMANDFATISIQVSRITGEDSNGEPIRTSLYRCLATIYGNNLVIEDNTNTISTTDFISLPFGGGSSYELNKDSLVIPLSDTISDNTDLDIWIVSDCGNYEEGGTYRLNPNLFTAINNEMEIDRKVIFDIVNNPILNNNLVFECAIRDITKATNTKFEIVDMNGIKIKETQLVLESKANKYLINLNGLNKGVYFINFEFENSVYIRKFIITD